MTISWDDLIRDAGDAITSFEPIPEGDYDLECVDAKVKPTKDGKKKMFEVKCKVVGGAHNGRFIWDNIVLTTDNPNALGFFFKKMAGFGLTADYFKTQRPSDERIVGDLKGRRLRAKIGHRVWNGEKKNEVKNYYPQAGAGGALPPSVPGAPPMPSAPAAPPAPAAAPPAPPAAPAPQAPPAAPQAPPAAPAQDPWAAQAPAAPAGDPWAQQPAAPAAPPAPPAQEYQAPPAPPAAPAQQEYQAPPAPPAPPAAPAPEQQAPPAAPEQPQAAATPPVPPPPAAPF